MLLKLPYLKKNNVQQSENSRNVVKFFNKNQGNPNL